MSKDTLVKLFFAAGLTLSVIADVPQIVRLIRRKTSDDISLHTFGLVWAMVFCYASVAVLTSAHPLVLVNYGMSLTAVGCVMGLSIYYRKRPGGRRKQ
jgi:uncharacterized protein with PQ loop repeat